MRSTLPALTLLLTLVLFSSHSTSADEIVFFEQSLPLPGAPAAMVAADLDGDGLRDLAMVVVYTEWDEIGVEEYTEMDQVEGMVEVLTIVPVIADRREVRVHRGRAGGGYETEGVTLPLPLSVLTLEPGSPGTPVVALTDEGLSALRLDLSEDGPGALRFEPLIASPPVLAGTGTFLADLRLAADLTGDGVEDYLLPRPDGLAVHRGGNAGLEPEAVFVIPLPGDGPDWDAQVVDYPLPRLVDLDGDDRPELVFRVPDAEDVDRFVLPNLGDGRFGAAVALDPQKRLEAVRRVAGEPREEEGEGEGKGEGDEKDGEIELDLVYLGPLTPGVGESSQPTAVYLESLVDEDAGLRKTMAQVREPDAQLWLRPLGPGLTPEDTDAPWQRITGHVPSFAGGSDGSDDDDFDMALPAGFQDLNADGRVDLVTITNDITVMKAVAILATKRLTLDLGFHPWCQGDDGMFRRAPGPPLESRLTFDLNDLELRRRSLFAGDFDGDGRADFLQLGRAKEIGIHRGRADCSYPERADATVELRDSIRDLALVDARDLDGDGRTDLVVTHPQRSDDPGVTPTVRLDLYLSGPRSAPSTEASR